MASDFQRAIKSINESSPIYVNPINDNFMTGYGFVNDIYGKPAFILKIENDRGLFKEYMNSLSFFLLSLLVVGFILGMATLIYLDKNVLSRLSRLDKDIIDIGKKGSISSRLSIDGEDELSSLATSINTMLSKLETSQHKFKESELKFRSIVQLASDGIILADKNGKIIFWNRGAQLIFGYNEEELIGKPISLLTEEYKYPHQKALNDPNMVDSNYEKNYESLGYKKDGTKFDLEISHTSWKIKGEKHYCAIIRDITDRKHAENEIMKSLSEKEAMLKEIHHRVKNNMQIISSLLSLQCRYIKDKEAFNVFKESQNRVKSMALVHEKLYQSEGLAEIDFTKYIKNLVRELFRSYGVNKTIIDLNIDAEKIFLDIDTAIPCGLIINELVSNSLKYAFDGRKGEIYINLYSFEDKISLIMGDNGKGLPDNFDLENAETLGLRLVKTLVDQLNGTLELIINEGVEFKIIFKPIK
jgi:PAS domain S-box-containing protein